MISIIGRKYGNSKNIMLSIRIKTDSISTAIALGKAVSEFEFSEMRRNIKAARNAYKKGAVVFLDNELQARLWRIVKVLTEKENERKFDVQTAKSIINNAFETVKGKKEIPAFKEFLDIYIDGIDTGSATWNNRAKQTTSRTASNYKSMRSNLNKYETETGNIINWESIDFLFIQKFKAWLIQRSLRNNTVTMYLSLLRSVLRTARRLHYFDNTDLMENVWVPPIEETDNVYLDEAKLRELEKADLTFEGILTYIEEITDTEINLSFTPFCTTYPVRPLFAS